MNYAAINLAAEMARQVWAMQPDVLASLNALALDWSGAAARPTHSARGFGASPQTGRGIAVLRLFGPLSPRADVFNMFCGGTALDAFRADLAAAVANETIGQILIECDSPGGSVYGCEETARAIRQARQTKPVVAIANSTSASAAYWLTSQADESFVTPGGEVGSVGVYGEHTDVSKAFAMAGRRVTVIGAGKYKTEGSPFAPLDAEAKRFMQERVDSYYSDFVKDVALGRTVGVDQVRKSMGGGRMFGADAALAAGMVDGVMTIDQVVQRMQRAARSARPGARAAAFTIAGTGSANELRMAQLAALELGLPDPTRHRTGAG